MTAKEIKEMLHCIEMNCKHNKCFGGVKLDEEDCKLLLDYITNLQQENENTKKLKERYQLEKEIYKSRCEKAIEYIKNLSNEPNVFGHYGIDGECKKWLLKILKGK